MSCPARFGSSLADVIEMRALLPVARVRAERRGYAILNEDAKTVVRLYVEHGRLSATAVKGYETELDRVRETLGLDEATVPLVDEAILADGGDPAGISSKLALTLDPEEPANVAAARVFERLLEVIDLNLPGTLDDVDSEFLHDLRVAVRRSRSLQRQFKALYPGAPAAPPRRVQAPAGRDRRPARPRRLPPGFPGPAGLAAGEDARRPGPAARCARDAPRTRAERDPPRLARPAHRRRARRLERVRHGPQPSDRTVHDLASHRIKQVYRKMVKMGARDRRRLARRGPARAAQGGQGAALPARVLRQPLSRGRRQAVVKTLKALQDQLGRFQDREVQANALRELAPAVSGEPATLMAMGVLVERLTQEQTPPGPSSPTASRVRGQAQRATSSRRPSA